jgi:hypothetical protein
MNSDPFAVLPESTIIQILDQLDPQQRIEWASTSSRVKDVYTRIYLT